MSGHDGAARWLQIHDDLLRGLAHDMSNRVATISAVAFMLDGERIPDERVLHGLRTDADRLELLLQALRQLPRRNETALEPLLVDDVITQACQLHAHHPDFRDRVVQVEIADGVVPVLADSTALVHALCVALVAAMRAGDRVGGDPCPVVVRATRAEDVIALGIHATTPAGAVLADGDAAQLALDHSAMAWLIATSHGMTRPHPFGSELLLPTLQAGRRRTL